MKKQFVYIGSVIILILSIFTFVVFGFGTEVFTSIFGKSGKPVVLGKVDNTKIDNTPGSECARYASNLKKYYDEQNKNNPRRDENVVQEYNQIFSTAFMLTARDYLFNKAVKQSSYKVPANAIERSILPYFYDENGRFSQKIYNQTPDANKAELRENASEQLTLSRFTEDALGSTLKVGKDYNLYGLKTNDKAAEFIASMNKEQHAFEYAAFDTTAFPSSEAVKYGKDKAEVFIQYDLSAITTTSEKEAKQILKQLKAGELDFTEAVTTKSQKLFTNKDGKVTNAYRYQLVTILENEDDLTSIVTLTKDSYSSVIKTKSQTPTYTIFRCDGDAVSADFTKSAMVDVVTKYIKENNSAYINNYFIEKATALKTAAESTTFAKAAKDAGVTVTSVPAFAINLYSDPLIDSKLQASEIARLSYDEELLTKAFALKENEVSEPLDFGQKIVVLKCTKISEGATGDADAIAEKVTQSERDNFYNAVSGSKRIKAYQVDFSKYFTR